MEEEIKNSEENSREELSTRLREILVSLGYDPDYVDPDELTLGELQDMIEAGAFGPNGIVISGDHGGPIPAE